MRNVNLSDSGEVNKYGHPMAVCTVTYPEDDLSGRAYPVTLDGDDLDSYCNTIDGTLRDLLDPLTDLAPNHPSGLAFNPSAIPSAAQREAFTFMVKLLEAAESLSGTLRYDVSADHTDCPEHDKHALAKVARIKENLLGSLPATTTNDDKE